MRIVPANEFYDYESKYTAGKSEHIIPARLTAAESRLAEETALMVHIALECRDYSRVDMIIRNGTPYVIEVNTHPGMTALSLFPDSAGKAGIAFYDIIMTLVKKAMERKKG